MTLSIVKGSFNSNEPLPVEPSQVTNEWCSQALGRTIRHVSIVKEIHGTASKIVVELTDNDGDVSSYPKRMCLKGGFNPQLLAIHPVLYLTYRREAEFYYHIAPTVDMQLPQAYFAGSDVVTGQGLVAMDDLTVRGCTFGNPMESWPVERVRAGVHELAALHAKTWAAPKEDFPWLYASQNPLHGILLSLFTEEAWAIRFAEGERPPVPGEMTDRVRMEAAFTKMWKMTNPDHICAIHGDAHLGNTFITPAGAPGFIDWQGLSVGSCFHDVAYFISGALTIEDRRNHEDELLDHYLTSLEALGGPRLEKEEAWFEYRKYMLHGFAWAIAAPQMQPKEVIFEMSKRHAAAIADHNSLDLLESLSSVGPGGIY